MSLIVRQLKQYHTNRTEAFIGTRCFLLDAPVNLHLKYFEIASGNNLEDYCFYVCIKGEAPAIKREVKRAGIKSFIHMNSQSCVRWNDFGTTEMNWENPPKEPKMAILVRVIQGVPDFNAPALFMYVPKAEKKPRRRTKLKPLPKGNGPLPYRL
ncbi:hypothetical protein D3C87_1418390 [compost metagenome]